VADVPIAAWLTEPIPAGITAVRGYLICATPRSGSYYLCDLMRSTGLLGSPHEYFGTAAMRRYGHADYPADIGAQIEMARTRGCTANGVFGAKLFPDQLADTPPGAIMAGMGQPLLIQLERADQLAQAISLTRAALSNSFFAGQPSTTEPHFDAPLIRDYLELLIRWNAGWQLWFARHGVVPLRLLYEDVMRNPQNSVDRVAAALGVGVARIDPARLAMETQRDALSDEWRERFLGLEPESRPFQLPRPAGLVRLHRRIRRLLRMLRLRRD
jgi:trehalose 2-sulfotransferase